MTEVLNKPFSRDEAIARLKALEPRLRERGVLSLYLFGSTARDQAGVSSDIDVFGDLDPDRRYGLAYLGLKFLIQDAIGRSTDFMSRESLHPALRDGIESSAIQVF